MEIKASKTPRAAVENLQRFPGARWFPGAELNFAENLLRYRDGRDALVSKREAKPSVRIAYEEARRGVSSGFARRGGDPVSVRTGVSPGNSN